MGCESVDKPQIFDNHKSYFMIPTWHESFGTYRLAYGNDAGLVIVDTVQKTCLMSLATPDLYGTSDPYQRAPKSPKRPDISEERSPTDQVCVSKLTQFILTISFTQNLSLSLGIWLHQI